MPTQIQAESQEELLRLQLIDLKEVKKTLEIELKKSHMHSAILADNVKERKNKMADLEDEIEEVCPS